MENPELLKQVEAKAQVWLGEAYDEATRKEVKRMLEADDKTEHNACRFWCAPK